MSTSKQVKCPMCREYLEIEESLQKGDVVYCSDCEEELRIVRLDPPKLKRIVEILEVYKDVQKKVAKDVSEDEEDDSSDSEDDDVAVDDRFAGFEDMYGEDFE